MKDYPKCLSVSMSDWVCSFLNLFSLLFSGNTKGGKGSVCVSVDFFALEKTTSSQTYEFPPSSNFLRKFEEIYFSCLQMWRTESGRKGFFFSESDPFDVWTWAKKGKGTMESLFARL